MSERHVIFGTAGHVDHGKSSLVRALTGTDPDRLEEEKRREMTIDLGFAFLELEGLPDPVAIVDVPGHEMFVRNMVAGATGIDAALFIVAADEGIMPQTIEHLDVLRCLRVTDGAIVLTKRDKVDAEMLELVSDEVRGLMSGTFLEKAGLFAISSITGEGLPELRQEMARIARRVKTRSAEGAFRLPIDRVFTLKGIGTVITGTVISGALATGQEIVCLPQGLELRPRTLQVHGLTVERIAAGQRAAIGLPGASKDDLSRGDVLASPGSVAATYMMDARLDLSPRAPRPLVQRARVRVHHGTREVMARALPLESDAIAPGESGLIQLRLEKPLVAAACDAFVLRSYSPMLVIGGGAIVDPHPPKRRTGAGAEEVARRETASVEETLIEALDRAGAKGMKFDDLHVLSGMEQPALRALLQQMQAEEQLHPGRRNLWFSAGAVQQMQAAALDLLVRQHQKAPWRRFFPLNDLAAGVAAAPEQKDCFRLAVEALQRTGDLDVHGEQVRQAAHQQSWTGKYAAARERILQRVAAAGLSGPSSKEMAPDSGLSESECEQVMRALTDAGELYSIPPGLYVLPDVFAKCRDAVLAHLRAKGRVNVTEARDLLNVSRKYLVPILEEFDRLALTVRQGDFRVMRGK